MPEGSDAEADQPPKPKAKAKETSIQRARRERLEEQAAARSRDLKVLITASDIEWDRLREYIGVEGLDPNFTDPSGQIGTTHQCAFAGHADILKWCLDLKADVNARTSIGRSVLHHACMGGSKSCVELLLDREADPNIRSLAQQTPLHAACQSNNYDCVMSLLHHTPTIIDIDANDQKMKIAEALTSNKQIQEALEDYREHLDERKEAELLDGALYRIFKLFDMDGNGVVQPEEFAEISTYLARQLSLENPPSVEQAFQDADRNCDNVVDWSEFRASHKELLSAVGKPYTELMNILSEVEHLYFQEKVRLAQEGQGDLSPVLGERARELSRKRLGFGALSSENPEAG